MAVCSTGPSPCGKSTRSWTASAVHDRSGHYDVRQTPSRAPVLTSRIHTGHIPGLAAQASTSQLKELTAYVQQKWTESTTWPPSSWNIFHRPVRTNNDVEGWHRRLNRFAQKDQLGFYVLLELLHQEAKIVSLQLRLVKQAKLQRFQKKTYRNLQGKILRYWDEFTAGQKMSSQLLKACSRVYAACHTDDA